MKTSTNAADANRVGSTGGSAAATSESKWRIRISDCYCEYEYELIARVDDVCIHDLYELLRERLKANDVHGRCVDPEENSPRTQEPPNVGVPPLATGSVIYALFEHMEAEHGLTLLGSELTEIISIVNASLEARLEWWMRNAECLALERHDLLKTLREIRDPRPSMEWQAKIIDAAIERNSPNVQSEPRLGEHQKS